MKKLIYPFRYFSGEKTLVAGLVLMMVATILARIAGTTFRGVVSQGIDSLSFGQLLLQWLVGWLVLSALLYAAARIFSRTRTRIVDLVGNQAWARLPLLFILLGGMLPAVRRTIDAMECMAPNEMMQLDLTWVTIYGFFAVVMLVWFLWWSYCGFAVATNLRRGKGIAIYIVCYLLAEVAATWMTNAIARW